MRICAGLCVIGGAIAWMTVRKVAKVKPRVLTNVIQPCQDYAVVEATPGNP
jgi:hypothetical protein